MSAELGPETEIKGLSARMFSLKSFFYVPYIGQVANRPDAVLGAGLEAVGAESAGWARLAVGQAGTQAQEDYGGGNESGIHLEREVFVRGRVLGEAIGLLTMLCLSLRKLRMRSRVRLTNP